MPTVALLNGHAFVGGLIVPALHRDCRVRNPARGFICLNEMLFGANMDPALIGIFSAKIESPATFRSLILQGHRFTAQQALEQGVVDGLGGLDETLKFVVTRELVRKGESGICGGLRRDVP